MEKATRSRMPYWITGPAFLVSSLLASCDNGRGEKRTAQERQKTEIPVAQEVPVDRSPIGNTAQTISSLAFSPDGKTLATANGADPPKLWDLDSRKLIHSLPRDYRRAVFVAFSPDGKLLSICTSYDEYRKASLFELATGRRIALAGQTDDEGVEYTTFSPDGRRLAGAGHRIEWIERRRGEREAIYKGVVIIWDVATGESQQTLKGHVDPLRCVTFSHDGRRLAGASHSPGPPVHSTLKIWETASWKEVVSLVSSNDAVDSLAFTPDGSTLLSGGGDTGFTGTFDLTDPTGANDRVTWRDSQGQPYAPIKLWEVTSGKKIGSWIGDSSVDCISLSPDGNVLASGNPDGSIQLWDLATGKALRALTGLSAPVKSIAWSPDGKSFAADGGDGCIRVWDAATGRVTHSLRFVPP